jgi:hypothetical protein
MSARRFKWVVSLPARGLCQTYVAVRCPRDGVSEDALVRQPDRVRPASLSSVEVRNGYAMLSWAQACPQPGRLQEASPLADAAAGMGLLPLDRPRALVKSIRRFPLPNILVSLGLDLPLGQRYSHSR